MNTLSIEKQYENPLLTTTCRYPADSWQMDCKTETASSVLSQYTPLSTRYKYDAKGHLVESSMPTCHEEYVYNGMGQRISMLHTRKGVFQYTYDPQGKLSQINDTRFQYDALGRLAVITSPNVPARRFTYERVRQNVRGEGIELDVDRLTTFEDSTGKIFTYKYTPENPLPVAVYCAGLPVVRYQWDERGSLPRLLSCATSLATWEFCYSEESGDDLPNTVTLTGPVVAKLGYWDLKSLQCKLGYDHLGTVKLITDQYNDLVKELIYDSFGNVISETEQRIYFPLGFAGGLRDIATGFVCFGFRDYDPSVGRFTTPDPALDMRGDGDIYDYCVDDPVNLVDVEGLRFKTKIPKPNRYPGDARSNNQHQQEKSDAKKSRKSKKRTQGWFKKRGDKNKESDIEAPSDGPDTDLEELYDALDEGYNLGSKIGGPWLGVANAASFFYRTKAATKALDKIAGMNINLSDSTSISGEILSDVYSPDERLNFNKGKSPKQSKQSNISRCTPRTQPRTSDGRFASCSHAK